MSKERHPIIIVTCTYLCQKSRSQRTVMGGRCQTFRCCGDFLQNWCHAWLFVASVSIWLGLLTSQLRHWTVSLSKIAFLKVKYSGQWVNSTHCPLDSVLSWVSRLESGSLSKMQPVETGHFPSLHHSQLTLTLTLTRLEAGETFFKSVNSRSTTSQLCRCLILNLKELDIDGQCTTSWLDWKPVKGVNLTSTTSQLYRCTILNIGQCTTSWKPVKDATCPHRPPASWSVLLHQCQINSPQPESVN